MPKVTNLYAPADTIQRNIMLAAAAKGLKHDFEIAKRGGLSPACYGNKRKNPRTWTVKQLVDMARGLGVSFEWLVTEHSIEEMK